jgi:3-deoxy-7-phosphoheptulonate synthase
MFSDCNDKVIENKIMFYDTMAKMFTEISSLPVTVVGRIAGQYAKPRTDLYETINGEKVFSFKGDNVHEFEASMRNPDPKRMTEGYFRSAATMNYIRQLKEEDLDAENINEKIDKFMKEKKNGFTKLQSLQPKKDIKINPNVFISHEALLLAYEEALTREKKDKYYALSGHLLWIGFRTTNLEGAHVEFFRGLENPVGIKVSKEFVASDEELEKLMTMIRILNPTNREGKIVLITRLGARNVENTLPKIIKAVKYQELKVVWFCDGVHGNTQKASSGIKTRKIDDVQEEILKTMKILKSFDQALNGVHLETSPEEVTECVGGCFNEIKEDDLEKNYTSLCDPRLNFYQCLEVLHDVAKELKPSN